MTVNFQKYQGTGNDFILIDNRNYELRKTNPELIERLCDRRFGIGADGLILLQNKTGYDFEMIYFNSDGRESSMCGNGGRCLVQFSRHLGIVNEHCRFWAVDGVHQGYFLEDNLVSLKMNDVKNIEGIHSDYVLNTGSPHYVTFVPDVHEVDMVTVARTIRYSARFEQEGINVNFVQALADREIFVRTYERGVEDETLSCGTGVVASSLVFGQINHLANGEVAVQTLGGQLKVRFEAAEMGYQNIFLIGPAERVFQGSIEVSD